MFFQQFSPQAMLIEKYLAAVFWLVAFDSIFLTFAYSALLDSSLTPLILGARIAVDLVFLTFAWRYIKLKRIEIVLLAMVLLSCMCATLPGTQYSSVYSIGRFFNDISGPLLFVLKVAALRSIFYEDIYALDIRKLSKALMYLSIMQILIFLYFSAQSGAYAGVVLQINLPAAWYIATFNHLGLAATVILIALSGKRSFLVSVAVVSVFTIALKGSSRNKVALLVMLAAAAMSFIVIGNAKVDATVAAANDLLEIAEVWSIDLDSEQVRSGLYLLTAGRSEEFYAILGEMRTWSWLVGLGPGFTYSYLHTDGFVEGYANSHFSPLSLVYKFGLVFALIFYFYLIGVIRALLKTSHPYGFVVGCALALFMLQSFFAFNLYAEPYYPIVLALGMALVSTTKRNAIKMVCFQGRSIIAKEDVLAVPGPR